eukprot:COSAG05_NODE_837_length_7054_cov_2.683537_3_plen_94_part_00
MRTSDHMAAGLAIDSHKCVINANVTAVFDLYISCHVATIIKVRQCIRLLANGLGAQVCGNRPSIDPTVVANVDPMSSLRSKRVTAVNQDVAMV